MGEVKDSDIWDSGTRLHESTWHHRTEFQNGTSHGTDIHKVGSAAWDSVTLCCYRRQWPRTGNTPNEVRQPRKCPYFFPYEPNFTPEEHKERQRDRETRQAMIRATILAAAIGAAAALIGAAIAAIAVLIATSD